MPFAVPENVKLEHVKLELPINIYYPLKMNELKFSVFCSFDWKIQADKTSLAFGQNFHTTENKVI
jgi:hypothetical protein